MSLASPAKSPPSSKSFGVVKGLAAVVILCLGVMAAVGLVSALLGLLLWPALRLVDIVSPSYLETSVGVYCVQVMLCPCYVALAVAMRMKRGIG